MATTAASPSEQTAGTSCESLGNLTTSRPLRRGTYPLTYRGARRVVTNEQGADLFPGSRRCPARLPLDHRHRQLQSKWPQHSVQRLEGRVVLRVQHSDNGGARHRRLLRRVLQPDHVDELSGGDRSPPACPVPAWSSRRDPAGVRVAGGRRSTRLLLGNGVRIDRRWGQGQGPRGRRLRGLPPRLPWRAQPNINVMNAPKRVKPEPRSPQRCVPAPDSVQWGVSRDRA